MKDALFRDPISADQASQSFAFDSKVAAVFDDMISRSIPGYAQIQLISAELGAKAVTAESTIYDLGCSTGTSLIKIAQKIQSLRAEDSAFARNCQLIGIDSSPDMILRCNEKIAAFDFQDLISAVHSDIRQVQILNACLVICHYTLQFLDPKDRALVIKSIYSGLKDEGYFIFSEKVTHPSLPLENILCNEYDKFKLQNGYTNVEIMRKRQALENVLIPFSLEQNIALLRDAGFTRIEIMQKDLCFVSFLAQK